MNVDCDSINTKDFEKFLRVQKNLSDLTVQSHLNNLNVFLRQVKKPVNKLAYEDIQDFMLWIKENKSQKTYGNYLCTMKVFFRDFLKMPAMVNDFKFPSISVKPKRLPSKEELGIFFDALPDIKYRIIFLALASSGLRISELLTVEVDKGKKILMPESHDGNNKKSWVSFYNSEVEELLKKYDGNPFEISRNTIAHLFKEISNKTGINISAQTLRSIFAREMNQRGVSDRHIDAFCGRLPQSVLARNYSDYSLEVLKEIYDKADIHILE